MAEDDHSKPFGTQFPSGQQDFDLSIDDTDVSRGVAGLDSLVLEEHNQRMRLQQDMYSFAAVFVVLLYGAAIAFGASVFYLYKTKSDWHLSLVAGAFLVAPTIVLLALLRAIYDKKAQQKEESNLPLVNLIKEVVGAFKEAWK